MSFPPCISHQEGPENASYCSVRPCPAFCSPVTTVISFPLIPTSQCCLHNMPCLYCRELHLMSYHAVSPFPLSSHLNPYMSQYPILPHPTPLCSSYLYPPAFSLIAGNILSTPTQNPTQTPIPVKISDYDRLELRVIIVDSTSREMLPGCHCRCILQ